MSSQAVVNARLDLLNLVAKLLGEDTYGGLVDLESPDIETALRRFDAQQHVVAYWNRERLTEFLQHLSADDAGQAIAEAFDAYDAARKEVLPLARTLAVEPLAIAAHSPTREKLLAFIDSYESLNRSLSQNYDRLFETFGPDANEMLANLLLLETIVLRAGGQSYAIAAPTHPLFLWHYGRYCQIIAEQRDRLDERDRILVSKAARNLPNFLTSLFVPATAFGDAMLLPYVGRLGPLPYFGERVEASVSNDGLSSVRKLIDAYLTFEPHSRLGIRIALVDPPDAGVYLSLLADMAQDHLLEGAHLVVYRSLGEKLGVELRLEEAEEERIARVFRSTTANRRFTFEVSELREDEVGPPIDSLFHIVVAFDRSGGQATRARPASHPIQPLALPRRIQYRHHHKTVELEPAPGGPFDSYDKLVTRLAPGGGASYLSVHQDAALRGRLGEAAVHVPWMAVADRHVDRDLQLGAIRILTTQDGERDVAAFARSTASLRRPLRDVVRTYNAYISSSELDDLLHQLSDLLDSGLLGLRPDASGKTNHNRIKGLLGTLIAARWFRSRNESDRLLISLDSEDARRWLHLSDDPLQADLLGFEWTNDHCTVTVMEVKAVQSAGSEYAVRDGVVEGPAVRQMLSTRRLLAAVFAFDQGQELITTPARREVLREHLYRELTKSTYTANERKIWADRLQRLLDGEVTADLRCHLVDVRLGVDAASLTNRTVTATEGDQSVPVQITELNERLIESLTAPVQAEGSAPPEELEQEGDTPTDDVAPTAPHVATAESGTVPESEVQPVATTRPRALLGEAPGAYGKTREVWFDPELPEDRLPNPHVSITGETGSGKTQAIKAILRDMRTSDVPSLILDFKDDYSEAGYVDAENLTVYDPTFQRLPFNPLAPPIDSRSGQVNLTHHVHQLTEIVKRIYKLGDQQAYRLREAMKAAYEHAGVSIRVFTPGHAQKYPPFELVREHLDPDDDAKLLGRMSPIFDLELFKSDGGSGQFAGVLDQSTVVRLAQLPGDETKNSVAEFFLMALYNHLIRQPQVHRLKQLFVLDEAWRLVHSPFLEPLMREGRAFGLGVLIATQFPADLPAPIKGSTATKLFFSQMNVEQIRDIQRTIVGKTSGPEADHLAGVLRGLAPLTCVLSSKQHSPFVRTTITPYFQRSTPSAL